MAGRSSFPKSARLLARRDFDRASKGASTIVTPHFRVVRGCGPGEGARLGIIVSRRVGRAVARNRIKRLVREWFRQARSSLSPKLDLIVIARRAAPDLDLDIVARELSAAARRPERRSARS